MSVALLGVVLVALASDALRIPVAIGLALLLAVAAGVGFIALARSLECQSESVANRRESEAFLRSIIDNIPVLVSVKRASDLRFVQINQAGLDMLGVAEDEIVGKSLEDLLPDEQAAAIHAEERRLIAERTPARYETKRVLGDHGSRTVNITKVPITAPDSDVSHLMAIAEDVTDSVTAIRELETARAEAETANAAKSEFLSRMSHELRTPLNAVLGFGQLLEFEELTESQEGSVQQILRGGRHLLGLINEVLDISRIETGNLSLSVQPVALRHVVEETLELIRSMADEQELRLPDGPMHDWSVWVRADPQRLRQVLLNLLSNAVKYNEPGGSIAVRCTELSGKRVRVSVTDTGRGIAPEDVDRLFSPFERLDAEQSEIQGTGLGLALSKRLVEAMHGTIGLETQPGIGSTFWIELGSCDADELMSVGSGAAVDGDAHDVRARLLHIEDSLERLRVVELLLADHDEIELISIADAESAFDMAVRFPPDVVLLDLDVVGTEPTTLIEQLRADELTRRATIITVGPPGSAEVASDRHLVGPVTDTVLRAEILDALAVVSATTASR